MRTRFAMVAYRCEVAGVPTDSIDIQVRYFAGPGTDIAAFLRQEPVHAYRSATGEVVTWPLVEVLAIEELDQLQSGQEVVGFVTGADELAKWSRK